MSGVAAAANHAEAFTACDFFTGDNVQLAIGQGDTVHLRLIDTHTCFYQDERLIP